jgi:ribokinase
VSAAAQLVAVGSLNMDLVVHTRSLPAPGETVTGGSFQMTAGGKGGNQAVAAARAGASVVLIGAVGADDFGARLLEGLAAEGVDTTGVSILQGTASGVAAIVVDERGENQIAVASGANHELEAADVERAFEELDLSEARCAVFSLELRDEVLVAGAELAVERGMAVVVNPAPARPLPPALVGVGPILTPNRGEAAALTGHEDPAMAAEALAGSTGAPALVTAGPQGAFVAGEGRATQIRPPSVEVLDTTGAGDAFTGVLGAGLARDWPLDRAARWATVAATLSVRGAGARGAMPTASEIEAMA